MIRDEILMSLVDRAMSDREFRERARTDLEGALNASGYDLTSEEMLAVREFHTETVGLTDAELDGLLADGSRRQFPGGN